MGGVLGNGGPPSLRRRRRAPAGTTPRADRRLGGEHATVRRHDDSTGPIAMTTLPHLSADQIEQRCDAGRAADAIRDALRGDIDPAQQPVLARVPVSAGELMLMPSEGLGYVGTKVTSIAPGNPARGLDRIQAIYVLMDAQTLKPLATLDGSALVELRTAAVTAVAADALARRDASRMVVFGSGPQARAHIAAMQAIRPIEHVVIAALDAAKSEGLAAWVVEHGMEARIGQAMSATSAIPEADIVVTATTSAEPLFDGSLVRSGTFVAAVGSHDADRRELDPALLRRSTVVVEDRATALRQAGDIALAIVDGALGEADLVPLRDLARGEARVREGAPRVFKSVGMGWEDLVVAVAAFEASAPRAERGTGAAQRGVGGIGWAARAHARERSRAR